MSSPDADQFDPAAPLWYYCPCCCVRGASLVGNEGTDRRAWIVERLAVLVRCFAVEVGAYAVQAAQLHLLLRPAPQVVAGWSNEQVAAAWLTQLATTPLSETELALRVQLALTDKRALASWRQRLSEVSWFMRAVKEPLSRLANREDACEGIFWEGRQRAIPVLDRSTLLALVAYCELRQLNAGEVPSLEQTAFNSLAERTTASDSAAVVLPIEKITAAESGEALLSTAQYRQLLRLSTEAGDKNYSSSKTHQGLNELLQQVSPDVSPAAWLQLVFAAKPLRGKALGTRASLGAEAKRRGQEWLQNSHALQRR